MKEEIDIEKFELSIFQFRKQFENNYKLITEKMNELEKNSNSNYKKEEKLCFKVKI